MTTPIHEARLGAPKRIGLLLGAGASRPLGLPLMTDFLPLDFRDSIGDPKQEIIFDMAFNWSMAQHSTSLDFELLYTTVDALTRLQPQDPAAIAFVPHREDRGFLFKSGRSSNTVLSPEWAREHAQALLDLLKAAVHDRVGNVDAQQASELYTPLFDRVFDFAKGVREVHCFTTNYDRSIESIWEDELESRIKVKPRLIRGFTLLNPNRQLEFDPTAYDSSSENTETGYVVKLYKLHGGLNWIKAGDRVLESPTNDYLRRNVVVYPLRKHVIDQPFRTLIERFQTVLKSLGLLIIIGNSLRDEHLRDALTEAMRADSRFKVIILDPNAPALSESFGDTFDESFFPVQASFGESNWEKELLDGLLAAATYGAI